MHLETKSGRVFDLSLYWIFKDQCFDMGFDLSKASCARRKPSYYELVFSSLLARYFLQKRSFSVLDTFKG